MLKPQTPSNTCIHVSTPVRNNKNLFFSHHFNTPHQRHPTSLKWMVSHLGILSSPPCPPMQWRHSLSLPLLLDLGSATERSPPPPPTHTHTQLPVHPPCRDTPHLRTNSWYTTWVELKTGGAGDTTTSEASLVHYPRIVQCDLLNVEIERWCRCDMLIIRMCTVKLS